MCDHEWLTLSTGKSMPVTLLAALVFFTRYLYYLAMTIDAQMASIRDKHCLLYFRTSLRRGCEIDYCEFGNIV